MANWAVFARPARVATIAGVALAAMAARLDARQPPAEGAGASTAAAPEGAALTGADWKLERIVLADGKQYQGLVKSESPRRIEFVEVHRPRGKPMFLVVRSIDREQVKRLDRLTPAEQAELTARLDQHKHRTLIEAARMEDLDLASARRGGELVWQYRGSWFDLESTADEAMTRRSIVRLEQIFSAYRQVLPPRSVNEARLTIRIFGASDQYQRALTELGLSIRNPAVYLQDKNLILAGSNLNQFDAELDEVGRQHKKIRDRLDQLVAEAPARIKGLHEELKKNGIPAAERQKIVMAEQKKWEEQRRTARRQITTLERRNLARFNDVAGKMFRRLAHEAFHAYLEDQVYPRSAYDVPRWLNEGLAQTFEAGIIEADTLRIDTPNLPALSRLQDDLRGESPLGLRALLEAGSETYLTGHAGDASATRAYYYSWGLAYYLAFEQGVLDSPEFEAYLDPAMSSRPAVARFEKLVGMPLDEFEPKWREAMLALKVAP